MISFDEVPNEIEKLHFLSNLCKGVVSGPCVRSSGIFGKPQRVLVVSRLGRPVL